jgi:hypothetical protein
MRLIHVSISFSWKDNYLWGEKNYHEVSMNKIFNSCIFVLICYAPDSRDRCHNQGQAQCALHHATLHWDLECSFECRSCVATNGPKRWLHSREGAEKPDDRKRMRIVIKTIRSGIWYTLNKCKSASSKCF